MWMLQARLLLLEPNENGFLRRIIMAAKLFFSLVALALIANVVLGSTSPAPKPFHDITRSAGVGNSGSGNAAAWIDYDNDGDLDLYVVNHPGRGAFYCNKGDGAFESVSIGLDGVGNCIVIADYNADGHMDILVGSGTGNVRLYRNTGDGKFVNETASSGISVPHSEFAAWGNYDGDGKPDLFVGGNAKCKLYSNNGDGKFIDKTAEAFDVNTVLGLRAQPAWIDYDRDGDDDLFLVPYRDNGNLVLYCNKGGGTFTDVSKAAKVNLPVKKLSARIAVGDYNGDKYPDIYVFRGRSENLLFRNNKNGTFSENAAAAGVQTTSDRGTSGVAFFDYDGDGDLDLFANGGRYGRNNFFRNDGGKFTDITALTGLSNTDDTHDIAIGDYNGDGSPDIYEVNFTGYGSSVNKLYRNTCAFEPRRDPKPFIARMHVPHNNGGVVTREGRLYVWSGYTAPGRPHFDRTAVLEVYDPATNTWTRKADVPGARNGIGQFVLNGMIYSVGGEQSRSGSFTNTVYRYNPKKDAWTTMKPFPTNIWSPQSAVCAGKAYIIGGRHGYGQTYAHVYEYDQEEDTWIKRTDMPLSVTDATCVAYNSRIYVFGGNHKTGEPSNECVDKVQIYDPSTDSWSHGGKMSWKLPSPRAVMYKNNIYLFSAKVWDEDSDKWIDNEHIYRFSPTSGRWSRSGFVPPVKTGYGSQLAIIDRKVYFTEIYENGRRSNSAFSINLVDLVTDADDTRPDDIPSDDMLPDDVHPGDKQPKEPEAGDEKPADSKKGAAGIEPWCPGEAYLNGAITGFATGVALCVALLTAAVAGFAIGRIRRHKSAESG